MLYHPVFLSVCVIYCVLHGHILIGVYVWIYYPWYFNRSYHQELLLLLVFFLSYHVSGSYVLWMIIKKNMVRQWMLHRAIGIDPQGIMAALLFCESGSLYDGYRNVFIDTGLMHILVVSGYHMHSIKKMLTHCMRFFGVRHHRMCVSSVITGYVLFVCAGAIPLMRAWVDSMMQSLRPYERILWVWFILLCMYPMHSTHPSLVLSMWVSAWLRIRSRICGVPRSPTDISVDAWFGLMLPCVYYGIPVHPWGWMWDRVWSRWVIGMYPVLWLIWGMGPGYTARCMQYVMHSWIEAVAVSSQALPYIFIYASDAGWIALWYIVGLLEAKGRMRMVVVLCGLWSVYPGALEYYVHVFDVGRGSSILWMEGKHAVLLDTGDDRASHRVASYLRRHGIRLDALFLSHHDSDHIGGVHGLRTFLKDRKALWMPKGSRALPHPLKGYSYSVKSCRQGDSVKIGKSTWKVLHPGRGHYTGNDGSCVWLVEGDHRWIFPGDISHIVEKKLLQSISFGPVDGLILSHHGSLTSNHTQWFQVLRPRHIVASSHITPWNKRQKVMKRWDAIHTLWHGVTALEGDIHVIRQ